MRYVCQDPFNALARVIDIARRLDLCLDRLSFDRRDTGDFLLFVQLVDTASPAAQVFRLRVEQLLELRPEPDHA
ncbi:hypothetical protein [Chachezhania sediminis]|uniref:hypothetical protein n=1 Tax=Chachezhania sediminis TaxID=2599291 RepID=UPI00131DFAC7|nr:hypothetical protein [Chachezhania sediminis]